MVKKTETGTDRKAKGEKAPKGLNTDDAKASQLQWIAVAAAVFVIALAAAYLLTGHSFTGSNSNFSGFLSAFRSAPRVAIAVTAYNSTQFSYTIACGTSVIERIVGSKQYHRNETTIDFFVLNRTVCVVPNAALGSATGALNESIANCTARIASEPSIYINYSSSSNVTRIRGTSLYTSGDAAFLSECGIASEMS